MLPLLLLLACNPDPREDDANLEHLGQVGYRDGLDGGTNSGERGNIVISEVLWSGSVNDAGEWAPDDIFVELRNEGSRPINIGGWILELGGARRDAWRIPESDFKIPVGGHAFIAARDDRCFPEPTWVIPGFSIPYGDPFKLTLLDRDERLIEPAGSTDQPPFAGGYDLVDSRSMERIELMFGARGTSPHIWHYYTEAQVDVPNNVNVAPNCRTHTLASPGRANSPDYSGAYAAGSFD